MDNMSAKVLSQLDDSFLSEICTKIHIASLRDRYSKGSKTKETDENVEKYKRSVI